MFLKVNPKFSHPYLEQRLFTITFKDGLAKSSSFASLGSFIHGKEATTPTDPKKIFQVNRHSQIRADH